MSVQGPRQQRAGGILTFGNFCVEQRDATSGQREACFSESRNKGKGPQSEKEKRITNDDETESSVLQLGRMKGSEML
jgi:hypothetical protein